MNVTVNNSDSEDETQATQILHGMLDMDSWRTSNTRGSGRERLEKELTDSSPLPVSRSSPNYDFQGLAQTQTQTQHPEQEMKESQKENIHMRSGERESAQKQSNTPHTPALDSTRRAKGAKAVSFQSPGGNSGFIHPAVSSTHRQPTRSTTYPSAISERRTALPPSSQDSFGMVDDDPEQQFLAASKQFNVPLSELSRIVLASGQESADAERSEESKRLFSGISGRSRRSSSPHEGVVLVAATPSVSGSSQSQQSQPAIRAGPSGHRTKPGNQSLDGGLDTRHSSTTDDCLSDAPSSNIYSDLDDRTKDDRAIPALEATQPSTQVEDDSENNPVHPFDVPLPISNYIAGSNSLISMVDPKKRHRYQQYTDKPVGLPQVQHFLQSPSQTSGSAGVNMEETQPSFEPDTWIPPKRQFPRANAMAIDVSPRDDSEAGAGQQVILTDDGTSSVPPVHQSKPYSQEARASNNSIIPDSEPLRAQVIANSEGSTTRSAHLHRSHPRQGKEGSMPVDALAVKPDVTVLGKHRIPMQQEEKEENVLAAMHPKFCEMPAIRQSVKKGKGRDSEGSRVDHGKNPPLQIRSKSTMSRPAKKQNIGRPWANEEVPSSHPEQDLGKVTEAKLPPVNLAPTQVERKPVNTRPSAKSKRKTTAKNRKRPVDDSKSSPISSDDEATIPADENDNTDTADEEYTKPEIPGPLSRKRKRNNPMRATKADSKHSNTGGKMPSATSSTRQAKRLRSAAPTSKTGELGASRVFALWKQDGHYYPGTIHSYMGGMRYAIHFDDATESVVNLDQMRTLELRVGDDVLVPKLARGVKVVDVTKFESSDIVSVRLDMGVTEVHLEAIKIASRTISYAWKDRIMNPDTIVTIVGPERVKPSPTPSKLSMLSGPSTRGLHSSMFDRTAFIVTISPNGNPGKDKDGVMSAITTNGGKVINDWSNIVRMEGKHSQSNNRWVIEKTEAGWMGDKDIDRVFLVADDSCLKPKFLIALALGVPCLSVTWLYESIDAGEEKDWLSYMLPQGHSEALDARASQQVDVDWGNSVHQLDEIMDNRVPCKLFKAKSILCVGADMVPTPKGKKPTAQEKFAQDARNAVTRIILAMGADRVEAVTDVKHASASISSFDFVVIKEDHQYGSHLGNGRTVQWSWVKDCLIASRLLTLPDWNHQTYQSQDA